MNKVILLYASKHGSSKEYADMIGTELDVKAVDIAKFNCVKKEDYDTIIFVSGVYASKINKIDTIKNSFNKFDNIIICPVGFSEYNEEIKNNIENNFNQEELKKVNIFYLRGALDISKLSFLEKMMMNIMKKMLKKNPEENKEMLAAFDKPVSFINKDNIKDLISYVKEI
ncbi:flavodoxin domain-containing protein [Anaerofustis stercorihominis]|uniref:flavodoxin domain-containing protein n=1 Tax=Anaerofustis stercorihominis TaxID=214853 RepID=UPI00214B8471|nr:flavodoxin domain-containing protein [Anaerofustis stercorihominis]MCR2032427.1 flavodoxin domain-containing protein [Anaerofustis stercorihominis]